MFWKSIGLALFYSRYSRNMLLFVGWSFLLSVSIVYALAKPDLVSLEGTLSIQLIRRHFECKSGQPQIYVSLCEALLLRYFWIKMCGCHSMFFHLGKKQQAGTHMGSQHHTSQSSKSAGWLDLTVGYRSSSMPCIAQPKFSLRLLSFLGRLYRTRSQTKCVRVTKNHVGVGGSDLEDVHCDIALLGPMKKILPSCSWCSQIFFLMS